MFGQNDGNQQQDQSQDDTTVVQAGAPAADAPPSFTPPAPSAPADSTADANLALPPSPPSLPGNLTAPEPSVDDSAAPEPATTAPTASPSVGAITPDELVKLKQEALHHLSPLVEHLDQTPEEKFRTTMMLIQATDDSSKIKDAYESAQKITDEKVRAQALLDVVNEINYFTQHHKSEA